LLQGGAVCSITQDAENNFREAAEEANPVFDAPSLMYSALVKEHGAMRRQAEMMANSVCPYGDAIGWDIEQYQGSCAEVIAPLEKFGVKLTGDDAAVYGADVPPFYPLVNPLHQRALPERCQGGEDFPGVIEQTSLVHAS